MTTAVKERPIILSGPMVRAILDGRKTQTRRVVRIDPRGAEAHWHEVTTEVTPPVPPRTGWEFWAGPGRTSDDAIAVMPCPYGKPGDRLWVREGFWVDDRSDGFFPIIYTATPEWARDIFGKVVPCTYPDGGLVSREDSRRNVRDNPNWHRKPAIHMPRKLARLFLTIDSVRVERIQDITPDDAMAEGLSKLSKDGGRTWKHGLADPDGWPGHDVDGMHWGAWRISPVDAFEGIWNHLNAKRGFPWESNPWVWVITFSMDGGPHAQ